MNPDATGYAFPASRAAPTDPAIALEDQLRQIDWRIAQAMDVLNDVAELLDAMRADLRP